MRLIAKWLFYALLLILLVALVISAAIYGYNWYTYERHAGNIYIFISTAKDKCENDKFPIYVLVGNRSSKNLSQVTFRLSARRKGRSTDLAEYHSYTDDHIILPDNG